MAKLVILTQSLAGRTHELNADRTTVGRVEDNAFQIAEQSISSHHCEVLLRGDDVVVKDLDSTNGTFINDEKITEGVLKPGQKLRLGHVELRLETGTVGSAAPAPASPPPPAASGRKKESTTDMLRGVSMKDLEAGGDRSLASKAFSKKRNKVGIYFWVGVVCVLVVIVILFFVALSLANSHK